MIEMVCPDVPLPPRGRHPLRRLGSHFILTPMFTVPGGGCGHVTPLPQFISSWSWVLEVSYWATGYVPQKRFWRGTMPFPAPVLTGSRPKEAW